MKKVLMSAPLNMHPQWVTTAQGGGGVIWKSTPKNLNGCEIERIYVGSLNVLLPDPLKLFTVGSYPLFEQKCLCKMYTFMAEATYSIHR